jgi:hypothetical protein
MPEDCGQRCGGGNQIWGSGAHSGRRDRDMDTGAAENDREATETRSRLTMNDEKKKKSLARRVFLSSSNYISAAEGEAVKKKNKLPKGIRDNACTIQILRGVWFQGGWP